ncbi:MAG: recombination protein RecJ [Microgenomates group bacterium Gr01-1014_5]|nr:MAG: recombination protein RecJ [Microgenomates group bacterium Gr01-1014_5]
MKSIERIIEILLQNRGIKTKKQKEEFFNPPNPEKLTAKDFGVDQNQLDKAVKRIKEAIRLKEKIIVYGDYDVDGISATAILWETLDALGARAMPYIPSRFTEGYGLSETGIKNLKLEIKDCKLLITVDNGITAYEGLEFAKQQGLDVIITDHHQPGGKTPGALAVIHTTQISGSAVAWILARELVYQCVGVLGTDTLVPQHPSTPSDHLGLVALGTIADVLPLVDINRQLVVHGLEVLRTSSRLGIKTLCREAAVSQDTLDTYHIGFILGPHLNAAGRVDHAMESLRLLCVRDRERARVLAEKLCKSNRLRQEKTEAVVSHVTDNHLDPVWSDGNIPKLLYVYHASYEEGVIGIAAGRLVDKYHRPAVVLSIGDEYAKASARSISGVNILELLKKAGDGLFKSVGGHPMAAGFIVKTSDVELLGQRLEEISELEISDEVLKKNVRIDCEINLPDATEALLGQIAKFAPFGFGNPEPAFETRGVNVLETRLLGKEKNHLKLVLSQDANTPTSQHPVFTAIGFRMGEWYANLSPDLPVNIVYAVEENVWNGNKSLQLKLKSISI